MNEFGFNRKGWGWFSWFLLFLVMMGLTMTIGVETMLEFVVGRRDFYAWSLAADAVVAFLATCWWMMKNPVWR